MTTTERQTDINELTLALLKLKHLTPKEVEHHLMDMAMLVAKTDEELAKRIRLFYYREFVQPHQKAWLPTEQELDEACDLQRSEPKQEAWRRSGEEA